MASKRGPFKLNLSVILSGVPHWSVLPQLGVSNIFLGIF